MPSKALSWALAIFVSVPFALAAQVVADTAPVISRITIDRRNIFDDTEASWITRIVNRLHVRTRAPLIQRELLFGVGEPYDSAKVAETERILRDLRVFRGVSIDTTRSDSGLAVSVVTRDGWSTRPDFRFRSTGGSIAYTLALIEDNLLGTITQTQLLYRKEPDRTTTILGFRKRRLFAGKVGVAATYFDRSDGALLSGTVSYPFFSLASRFGAAVSFDTRRERILRFRGGMADTASDTLQRRFVLVRGEVARALDASAAGYLRVGAVAQVRRDDYAPQGIFDAQGLPRSVTGAFGGFAESRRARFLKVRGYESFGREEDVDLSGVVRVSVLLAPRALGYARDGIAPGFALHTGMQFPGGFALADFEASGLITGAGLDSGQVAAGATVVFIPSRRQHIVLHAEAGALTRPAPGSEYDLGLGVGPRAFQEHAFTGNRQYMATAEYRYTVAEDFMKVTGIGAAAFVDHGGAWWHGERRRSGWNAGVGVRLGPSRAPDQEATRIDIARRFATDREPGGWVLVVGKGFTFSTSTRLR